MVNSLEKYFAKAQYSSIYKRLLNIGLWFKIPFNLPHKIKITHIDHGIIKMELPFIRANKNHINGIHACALATLCEYVSGLSLVRVLSADKYRIILKDIHITYHYQAKTKVNTIFEINKEILNSINIQLNAVDAVFETFEVKVYDTLQNHICTGKITWQIKNWSKVKTAVS